ncbi:hypothetical protein [Acutalibacter muris]|uniref:hypothetical protein n=1 Tax=Acutalibacter muris TaxID=1796620 RepID=UPI0026F3EE81|nr:hypothetical protein [Acutalibacter muris]
MEQYMYAGLWIAIGLVLIFSMAKENKIFILAGAFFLVLGGWWLANALLPAVDLFAGGWGIALKCITGAALLILTAAFVKEYRKKSAEARRDDEEDRP